MKFTPFKSRATFALCLALSPTLVRAQANLEEEIKSTVTAEMGDLGGKFFGQLPDPKKTRHYYIAAEPELWNYAPSGRDEICGGPLPPPVQAAPTQAKLRYVQYTDASFSAKAFPVPRLGILGPVLRGVVGEYLAVTFLNRTGQPLSMHPHGVSYDKDSEGAYYRPAPGRGAAIAPEGKFTYVWHLDEESGPLAEEPSSKAWLYHSHVTGDAEINLGLVGFIIVTDPKRARPDGTPQDVDRELATLFLIFDESGLDGAAKEAAEYASLPGGGPAAKTWMEVQELTEIGSRYGINGRIFGNLPGLEMNEGERVRWYVFGLGSERDFHTAHWHGLRVLEEGKRRTDVVELLPASMKVADMVANNPGSWLLHCHVAEHMTEGMFARYVVHPKDAVGVSRTSSDAFFGLSAANESLHIARAEATLDFSPETNHPGEIQIEGRVTVFEAFSVANQPIRFRIGEKSVELHTDQEGRVEMPGAFFRAKNADDFGVIRGGHFDFELKLSGQEWRETLRTLGTKDEAGTHTLPVAISMTIGEAQHVTNARLTYHAKQP